jgi:tetratricopeptide (TPR) repeat protein
VIQADTLIQHINGKNIDIPRQLTPYAPISVEDECLGRSNELEGLQRAVSQAAKVVLLNGLGGIGKTTLAKAWLQTALSKNGYQHFAWIEVGGQDNTQSARSLLETIAFHPTLAKNLQLPLAENAPLEQRFTEIMNALRQLKGPNVLVIDNAGEELGNADIRAELPMPPEWHVLLTSRNQLHGFTPFPLDKLEKTAATALFQKHYTAPCTEAEINAFLQEIDYHTLSIELLAKTLQNHYGTLKLPELTTRLQKQELNNPDLQRRISLNHSKEETAVYKHLLTAFSCATLNDKEQQMLARCCALPPGQSYTATELLDWCQVTDDEKAAFLDTLQSLIQKGWLNMSLDGQCDMHRMVQQAVWYQLQPDFEVLEVLVNSFTQKMDSDTSTNFTLLFPWRLFGAQLMLCLPEQEQHNGRLGNLMNNMGIVYLNLGEYNKARELLEAALNAAVKNFGPEHPTVTVRQSNLAVVYRNLGEYNKARELLEAALNAAVKNFGPEHPTVTVRQSNLAIVYRYLGEYNKAKELLEAALNADLKHLGPEHPNVAIRQSNLAIVYRYLGEYNKAKELLEAALKADFKNFGPEHPTVAVSQSNLALVYRNLGEYNKARELLEAALIADLKNFGPEHPNIGMNRVNLGAVFFHDGQKELAQVQFQQAYQLFQQTLGESHPHTLAAKEWLEDL